MSLRRDAIIAAFLSGTVICIFFSYIQPVDAQAGANSTLLPSGLFSELKISSPAPLMLQAEAPAKTDTPAPEVPEGKGKDVTLRVCTSCHAASHWSGLRHTREEWSGVIDDMVSRGMQASDEDLSVVNNYLATNLGPAKKDAPQ